MMSAGMLNQWCEIWREMPAKDEFGTPIPSTDDDFQSIGQYPCRLSRRSIQSNTASNTPETNVTEIYMLYLPFHTPIQAGDLVEIGGAGEYRASEPYRPNNHHTEVQVEREDEA